MIQRIQSVFLFLISASMGITLANPIWEKPGLKPGEEAELTALQFTYEQSVAANHTTTFTNPIWYLGGLLLIVGIVALVAIFQ